MNHKALFDKLIQTFDEGYALVNKYDSMPHQYGDETLYQSEMHIIQYIGRNEHSTITIIAKAMDKSPSACSQLVRRLRKKELVKQTRNEENNREYYLELTEAGWEIFKVHEDFDEFCMQRTYAELREFSKEDIETYINIQQKLNQAFLRDVKDNVKVLV